MSGAGARAFIVTGGNRGLGRAAAETLARAGIPVILTARDAEKGERAAEEIRRAAPGARVEARVLDLSSLASVRAFAADVLAEGARSPGC